MIRFPRGVSAVSNDGVVFTYMKRINEGKVRAFAFREVGRFRDIRYVGRIRAFYKQRRGCSPDWGGEGRFESARHCVLNGDICRVKGFVDMFDPEVGWEGSAGVVQDLPYRACRSWVCWVFARFINRIGYVLDRCIEEYDNVVLSDGNEGSRPDYVLFAGSEDGSLALFVPGVNNVEPRVGDVVRVLSYDYYEGRYRDWVASLNLMVTALVWFGERYVLPFRAYGVYPAPVVVRPGFSGSNAWRVGG